MSIRSTVTDVNVYMQYHQSCSIAHTILSGLVIYLRTIPKPVLKRLYLENVSYRSKSLHHVSDTTLVAIKDHISGLGYVLVCTNNNVSQFA